MIQALVELSNRYGRNPDFVLAGGGNTSYKNAETLWVKGSGIAMADITAEGFVAMDRAALERIFEREYPGDPQAREAAVLQDMFTARLPGEEHKRPSVEALVHHLMPQAFVLHIHPAAVNGMTCGKNGAVACARLFPEALWVPQTMPGYILAREVRAKITANTRVMFLENHGVFIGGETVAEIDGVVAHIIATLAPEPYSLVSDAVPPDISVVPEIRALHGICVFHPMPDISPEITPAFTPDHLVYCGDKIVPLQGAGFFACGKTKKEADIAAALFYDAAKIYRYAKAFGGAKPMDDWLVSAINNWEVEAYRKNVAADVNSGRLEGKIALITGGAQGFGLGLAEEMAAQGAYVIVADLNGEGAAVAAENINKALGLGRAMACQVDVTDEAQVKAMVEAVVFAYGGLDILISNAGIVRSGGAEELELSDFELTTKVNYTAYFLCVKHAARIMKAQNKHRDGWADIIQINSKSGLEGSNRNFAYAGSKFGGLGLTQSFALELAEHRIKVNSICPGNFLDGPLWCDPENGLFVQYLRAGKVPGAKTVEDVKRAYEAKVPMNRGCTVEDVARAIYYIVEQQYETGQALPVTGGQVMLH